MRIPLSALLCLVITGCNCGGKVGGDGGMPDDGGMVGDGGRLDDGGVAACVGGATMLAISPANSDVTISATPGAITFTATATLPGGGTADVTSQVNWSVSRADDTPPGTIVNGVYTPTAAGGTVTVKISDGCLTATTTVNLKLDAVFNDPGPTITARFNGTVVTNDSAKAPLIVYPNTETRFPRNIYKVLFQWRKQGNDYFRITFQGPTSKTVVYSDGAHPQCLTATPPAGCYEATRASWAAIAGSNAGGTVDVIIDGVAPGSTNVYRSASIKIGFSKKDVRGAIFYWSTTAAGVRRASVSDAEPEGYAVAKPKPTILPNSGAVKCIACHSVSRSGKKMIAATEAASAGGVFVYDVTLTSPPVDRFTTGIGGPGHEFGTISPDDTRAVATKKGVLTEYDVSGNGPMGSKVIDLPLMGGKATHPDWSPKGDALVYATAAGDAPAGASLAIIANNSGTWGSIRTLAPADGGTNLFPSYSPEGDYIAFSRGVKGGHTDLTTQLYVIKADGTAGNTGVELVKANRWVNNTVTAGLFENNQPTWAPPGDLQWVAFNSLRPYGVVFPTGGTQQIWVAAVDPALLAQGIVDPSWPAFRFAFQGLNENNHRAFWTLDVRVPDDGGTPGDAGINEGGGDGGMCIQAGSACSQTSGDPCCGALVCDQDVDGGLNCHGLGLN